MSVNQGWKYRRLGTKTRGSLPKIEPQVMVLLPQRLNCYGSRFLYPKPTIVTVRICLVTRVITSHHNIFGPSSRF